MSMFTVSQKAQEAAGARHESQSSRASCAAVTSMEAALTFDLTQLRHAADALPPQQLLQKTAPGGATIAHGLAGALHFFKAGELSWLVPWPNSSRTVYSYDAVGTIEQAVRPVLRKLLDRAPQLATAADIRGATALHLAARECADGLVYELLRAGASPLATTSGAARTPMDEAMTAGCAEALAMMLRALPRGSAVEQAAIAAAVAYAALPGAALSPSALAPLLPIGSPRIRRSSPTLEPAPPEKMMHGVCAEGGGWDVEAPPSSSERARCDIDQVSALSAEDFFRRFYARSRPVLIRSALSLRERCALARQSRAMSSMASHHAMNCGRTAYPSLTGQKHCGVFTLDKINQHPACTDAERTLPVCALKPSGGVNATRPFASLPVRLRYEDAHPPFATLNQAWRAAGSRQVFSGGKGSGAALHFHNAAYNVQFFGVKRWLLTPPRHAGITGAASTAWEAASVASGALPRNLPLKCAQGPGDMLLLPMGWGHATINSGFAIGVGNLFCDVFTANYTHDPKCKTFYPSIHRQSSSSRSANAKGRGGFVQSGAARRGVGGRGPRMSEILRTAFGGSFAADGLYPWSRDTLRAHGSRNGGIAARANTGGGRGRGMRSRRLTIAGNASIGAHRAQTLITLRRSSPALRTSVPAAVAPPPRPECARGGSAYRDVGFVHINKAGGTSMRTRLYTSARHQLLEAIDPSAGSRMHALGSRFFHASANLQRSVLGAQRWDAAFTFALVRNPFARQVSMFHFLLQEAACKRPVGTRPSHCDQRKLPAAGAWLTNRAQTVSHFRKWIKDMAATFALHSRSAHFFGSRSHGNERDSWFNASQLSWLVGADGRSRLVKHVIKLEELEKEWPLLQRHICGLERISYSGGTSVRRNPSSHAHYSVYYDDDTRKIVEAYVRPDLEAFGYAFQREWPPLPESGS